MIRNEDNATYKLLKNIGINAVYGMLSGMLLYVTIVFAEYILLLGSNADGNGSIVFARLCIFFDLLIIFFALAYKYKSILYTLLRSVVMNISLLVSFVLSAQFGLYRWINKLMNIPDLDDSTRGAALGMFIVAMFAYCLLVTLVANIVIPVWILLKNKMQIKK